MLKRGGSTGGNLSGATETLFIWTNGKEAEIRRTRVDEYLYSLLTVYGRLKRVRSGKEWVNLVLNGGGDMLREVLRSHGYELVRIVRTVMTVRECSSRVSREVIGYVLARRVG